MSSDSIMPTETDTRSAIVRRLSKWPMINAAIPNALTYLSSQGRLTPVVEAALKAVKQHGLDPIDEILAQVFAAQNLDSLLFASGSPAFKAFQERELSELIEKKVLARSSLVHVDNAPWPHAMPGEILLEAERRLMMDPNEELTPYRVDRAIEDSVIQGNRGSFYWDGNKRHLRLNPPGWGDKKQSPPSKVGRTVGDLTGVY